MQPGRKKTSQVVKQDKAAWTGAAWYKKTNMERLWGWHLWAGKAEAWLLEELGEHPRQREAWARTRRLELLMLIN